MLVKLDGQRVLDARQALGLSRDELAEKSGASRVTLYMVEADRLKLGCQLMLAERIADALSVPLEYLAVGPPVKQQRPDLKKA